MYSCTYAEYSWELLVSRETVLTKVRFAVCVFLWDVLVAALTSGADAGVVYHELHRLHEGHQQDLDLLLPPVPRVLPWQRAVYRTAVACLYYYFYLSWFTVYIPYMYPERVCG